MSYQSTKPIVLNQQLKVQELVVRHADVGLYTVATNTVSIDVGETVSAIVVALLKDNSASPILSALAAASCTIVTDTVITLDLGVEIAANDVIIVKYIVA